MDYTSSYAVGAPRLGHGTDGQPQRAVDADVAVLPTPRPQRMHWSTMLLVAGMAICLVGLLATVAGVPAKMGYDSDGAANRNKPSSSDPSAITKSLDGNMKWIDQSSSDGKGGYVYYIKSINRSEAAIPGMVQALVAMNDAVRQIDGGIGEVGATTAAMATDMQAMAEVSGASADTMDDVSGDIGFLSKSMLALANSTGQLTARMAGIEKKAGAIASGGTGTALKSTTQLNASLPSSVPPPIMSDGKPLVVPPATGGGTDGAADAAAVDGAPVLEGHEADLAPGAQPPRPLRMDETGAAQ
ncbi:MAG: hypothetical protein JWM98_3142 [Thermoleophilia bacterium]|nr:hypothetical protein [Thermoleophilia bacterium]